jgi:hypothetical protein
MAHLQIRHPMVAAPHALPQAINELNQAHRASFGSENVGLTVPFTFAGSLRQETTQGPAMFLGRICNIPI